MEPTKDKPDRKPKFALGAVLLELVPTYVPLSDSTVPANLDGAWITYWGTFAVIGWQGLN